MWSTILLVLCHIVRSFASWNIIITGTTFKAIEALILMHCKSISEKRPLRIKMNPTRLLRLQWDIINVPALWVLCHAFGTKGDAILHLYFIFTFSFFSHKSFSKAIDDLSFKWSARPNYLERSTLSISRCNRQIVGFLIFINKIIDIFSTFMDGNWQSICDLKLLTRIT